MKKFILIIVVVLSIVGCREHVYHTYYGDIDTDTMPAIHDLDSSLYYTLKITELDSAQSAAMGLEGVVEIIFYSPSKNSYFFQLFGSDGGSSQRFYFNPDSTETFYNLKNHEQR